DRGQARAACALARAEEPPVPASGRARAPLLGVDVRSRDRRGAGRTARHHQDPPARRPACARRAAHPALGVRRGAAHLARFAAVLGVARAASGAPHRGPGKMLTGTSTLTPTGEPDGATTSNDDTGSPPVERSVERALVRAAL